MYNVKSLLNKKTHFYSLTAHGIKQERAANTHITYGTHNPLPSFYSDIFSRISSAIYILVI